MNKQSRRQFLTKTALATAGVWVVPQVISVDVAAAQSQTGSRPPGSTPPPHPNQPPPHQQMGGPLPADLPGQLPFTGDDLEKAIVLGAAATAAGAALIGLGHEQQGELNV